MPAFTRLVALCILPLAAVASQFSKRGISILATSVSDSVPATNYVTSGAAGHCGVQNQDSDMVAALAYAQFQMSYCGKAVVITTSTGVSATGAVEDSCDPSYGTCHDGNGIDTSNALFEALGGSVSEGGHLDVTYTIYDVDYYVGIDVGDATVIATGVSQANTEAQTTTAAGTDTNTWEAPATTTNEPAANTGASVLPGVGAGDFAAVADEPDSSAEASSVVESQTVAEAAAAITASVSAPSAAGASSDSVSTTGCEAGAILCGATGKSFSMCSNGSWINMGSVAEGTLCSGGKIDWDPAAQSSVASQAAGRMIRRHVKHRAAIH